MTNINTASFKSTHLGSVLGTSSRTLGDRFGDVFNVMDFGADPTGVSDSQPAIQAAVNWTSTSQRGIIFFPPGTYKVNSSIDFSFDTTGDRSIIFAGTGSASVISGSVNGYILDRNVASGTEGVKIIENLKIVNGFAGGGGIRIGGTISGTVRNCVINADNGVVCTNDPNSLASLSSANVLVVNCDFSPSNPWAAGTNAIILVENSIAQCCDISAFDVGVRMFGTANCVIGGRIEVNNTGILLGQFANGSTVGCSQSGFLIAAASLESNGTAIDFVGGSGEGLVTGVHILGFQGAAPYSSVLGYGAVSSTTITGSPSGNVFVGSISSGGVLTVTSGTPPSISDTLSGTGVQTGTCVSSGSNPTFQCGGSPSYGINCRSDKCTYTIIQACTVGSQPMQASIAVGNTSPNNRLTFIGVTTSNSSTLGGVTWSMPTNADAAKWINCDNPAAVFIFSNLPSSSNVVEGDTYDISDSANSTFLSNPSPGGGSGSAAHRRVRWNASASTWQVVG